LLFYWMDANVRQPLMWGGPQCELVIHVHSIQVYLESYSWYQPSSVAPECLASEVAESSVLCNVWKKVFDVMGDESVWLNRSKWLISQVNIVVLLNGWKCKFSFGHESALHVHFIWVQFELYLWSPCIWRTSKSEVVHVMCMNLKTW
jgi:hypothetical protein